MQQTKTGMVLGLAAVAAAIWGLTGCSSPKADFTSACVENSSDETGCQCMADRLERNLDDDRFGRLAEFMVAEQGDVSQSEAAQVLDDGTMQELLIAAKQCEADL
ncbi:hypothetical protein [Guyparkeria sp.]|uniref:hypothetical protein n=1 Tax=Guyparkeria sp. TaxID=2035736 RepID=UPI0035682F59